MNSEMLNNIAKTLNAAPEVVQARADEVLAEQGAAWKAAGRSDEDCYVLALRVAARNITSQNARMRRAGADTYEGMFISCPRPKEWGKILYNKMKNQLMNDFSLLHQKGQHNLCHLCVFRLDLFA